MNKTTLAWQTVQTQVSLIRVSTVCYSTIQFMDEGFRIVTIKAHYVTPVNDVCFICQIDRRAKAPNVDMVQLLTSSSSYDILLLFFQYQHMILPISQFSSSVTSPAIVLIDVGNINCTNVFFGEFLWSPVRRVFSILACLYCAS